MITIHPKVLAAFITGHIATLTAVALALFKVFPADPKVVLFLGEALTVLHFAAGYATPSQKPAVSDAAAFIQNVKDTMEPLPPEPKPPAP